MKRSSFDLLAILAVLFVIALGVLLFGLTALRLGRQGRRACAWRWKRRAHD